MYSHYKKNIHMFKLVLQEMFTNSSVQQIFKNSIWFQMNVMLGGLFNEGKNQGVFPQKLNNETAIKTIVGTLFTSLIFNDVLDLSENKSIEPLINIIFNGLMNSYKE